MSCQLYYCPNKTGALDALRSDVGIVYSKGGPVAIAITVDGMPKTDYTPDNAGSLLIADLALMLIDGLTPAVDTAKQ
jgi:beta-lactamase class A